MENKPRLLTVALAVLMAGSAPAFAQTTAQLQTQINQLQREVAQIKAQLGVTASGGTASSAPRQGATKAGQGAIEASIDSIRVGWIKQNTVQVTSTMTIRNTGASPMIVNYLSDSLTVVDDHGYEYRRKRYSPEKESVRGIPVYGEYGGTKVDPSAVIDPGSTRTITFTYGRVMNSGQTPGNTFDLNATFIQFEDMGQGRYRKVRDYPVAFTGVTATGGKAATAAGSQAMDAAGDKAAEKVGKLLDKLIKK